MDLTAQKFVLDPQLLAICAFIVPVVVEFITKHGVDSKVKQYSATGAVALAVAISVAVALTNGSFHIASVGDAWNMLQLALAQFTLARMATEAGVMAIKLPEAASGSSLSNVLFPNFGVGVPQGPTEVLAA